ncbi:hypothetical protein bthur0013_56370 [Bacillus thuringiensis IBL 200]|nr:hypothetical protein bthur0013_56370 [Bacillus thuringiensis IBL 200]
MMRLRQFKEMLDQGAIPIGLTDQFSKPLRQFDEIQYKNEVYLIIWHPIYREFVGSHESGDWIPYTELHQSIWIKNLKEHFVNRN